MREMSVDKLENLITNKGEYFVEFYTTWCADCKMMEPVIKSLEITSSKLYPRMNFIKIDAEVSNTFKQSNSQFKVLKVPSFFYIKNGKINHLGYEYIPEEVLLEKIKEHI